MSSITLDVLEWPDTAIEISSDHKPTQALALDPSGARMVTGGIDGVLKYWDFGGMNGVHPEPFRELIPVEGHPILSLSYNANGSLVLCVTSDARARIFDREGTGRPVEETIKGDQYIRTPENTKGHTHNLSYGEFHPRDSQRFLTSSYDSTVRLWDLQTKRIGMDQNIPNLNCFKCVDSRNVCGGNKLYVSSATYSTEGSQVIAGCSDGSLHLFHEKHKYGKGIQMVRPGHMAGSEITDVKFVFGDDVQLVSRGMDDCINFWDLRKFKEPIKTWTGIETTRALSNMTVSPDQRWLVMGTATGELASIDLESGELGGRKKLPARQLIRTDWNKTLNQLFVTSADGNLFISYHEEVSKGGALSFIHKQPSKHRADDRSSLTLPSQASVFSYDDLLESGKYRENKLGEIRELSHRTKVPKQADVFSSSSSAIDLRRRPQEKDIQQQLLEFAEDEDQDDLVRAAYRQTQPVKILDYSEAGGKVDSLLKQTRTYCPRCGLKICTCGFMKKPRLN